MNFSYAFFLKPVINSSWISHHASWSLSSYLPPSALCNFYVSSTKQNNIKLKRKQSLVEATMWHSESHSVLFSPSIFTLRVNCNELLDWFKVSAFCWVPSGTTLGHSAVSLCHGYLATLNLQDWPRYVLQ